MSQRSGPDSRNALVRRLWRHGQTPVLFGGAKDAARSPEQPLATLPIVQATLSTGPSDPAMALAVQRVTASAPAARPEAVLAAATPAAPPPAPKENDDPTWRRLQAITRLHRTKATEAESPSVAIDAPEGPPATPTIQRQTAPLPAALTSAADAEPPSELPHPVAGPPLEAVWPVERRPSPVITASSAVPPAPLQRRSDDRADTAPADATYLDATHEDTVRQRLGDVAVGQPTRSVVELIPPRRPRPTPAAAPPSAARPTAGAPDLIPTEIGPLPADLWRMLGDTPPGDTPPGDSSLEQRAGARGQLPESEKEATGAVVAFGHTVGPAMVTAPDVDVPTAVIRADTTLNRSTAAVGNVATDPPTARAADPFVQRAVANTTLPTAATPPIWQQVGEPVTDEAEVIARAELPVRQPGVAADSATIAAPPVRRQVEATATGEATALARAAESPRPRPGATAAGATTAASAVEPTVRRQIEETPPPDAEITAAIRAAESGRRSPAVDETPDAAAIARAAASGFQQPSAVTPGAAGVAPAIQRQAVENTTGGEDGGAVAPPAPAAVEAAPDEPAPAAPEVDLDDLARRVYADVKRRLHLEWERARGR